MKKKEQMNPLPEQVQYPIPIVNLLKKYPNSPIIMVNQALNEHDFEEQKRKQSEYQIEGGAIGIVTTVDNKFVLTRRTKPHSGWALPGGRVEPGEAFDDAFTREVAEECGVGITITSLVLIENKRFISPTQETLRFWLAVFQGKITSDTVPFQTEEAVKEGLEIGIFTLDDLPAEMVLQDKEKLLSCYL